jgi:hypothetical protein
MTFDNKTRGVRTNLNFSLVVTTVCVLSALTSVNTAANTVYFGLCVQHDFQNKQRLIPEYNKRVGFCDEDGNVISVK